MNILIPHSWLKDYLSTAATPDQIQKYLSLCGPSIERTQQISNDTVYDIEVTTNRPDCLSVLGIAREAAAILPQFGLPAKLISDPLIHSPKIKTASSVDYLKVKIDHKLCPRFSALLIKNVQVKSSPELTLSKLTKVGMRGLNNIIDVTNLLMHELGQPIHVFDYDKISHHMMTLRASHPGETITTLDGKSHTLPGNDIVIEDGSGTLIDLCGIMGGLNSAVTADTKNVLLFVQTYHGPSVRRTSMSLAHRTSAAVLFEKDLPTEQVLPTLELAAEMLKQVSGGLPEPTALDILSGTESSKSIKLPKPLHTLSSEKMGVDISAQKAANYLKSLGFTVKSQTEIQIPFYRKYDISIPEDLVEEVARLYGYHNIPSEIMSGELPAPSFDKTFFWERKIKTALKYFGFTEIYSYSLVAADHGLKLSNPLTSDWLYLRTSLFPSHQKIMEENQGRVETLNLFEIANVYLPRTGDLPEEQPRLILSTSDSGYYRFKGLIVGLLSDLGILNIEPEIKIDSGIQYWEIGLDQIIDHATDIKTYTPISKFSPIIEDINVLYQGSYATIVKQIQSTSPLITSIKLVDKYGDKLTLRLTFHSKDKQLSDADVAPIRNQIIHSFS